VLWNRTLRLYEARLGLAIVWEAFGGFCAGIQVVGKLFTKVVHVLEKRVFSRSRETVP
jgi:hypothetical protein